MENQDDRTAAFIIAGMHRSGTSLTSSLMKSAGINVGTRLVGATPGNPKGHFENWDFVDFHVDVLKSQGLSPEGWILQKEVSISQQLRDEAKLIIASNSKSQFWGWKDPRTTLFLNFWQDLLPQSYFIFTYRAPWEVVDSLYRRGDQTFAHNPTYALEVWMHYNKLILDFYRQFPERSLLLNVETLIADRNCISKLCKDKFGIELQEPTDDIIDKSLMKNLGSKSHRPLLIKKNFPEAITILNDLNDQSDLKSDALICEDSEIDQSVRDWIFQDWFDFSQINKSHKITLNELQQTQTELKQLQSQLQEYEVQLQESKVELQESQVNLSQSQQHLKEIEASNFWKIKNAWNKLGRFNLN
jgi:O-antigen biosynthesis protein